MEGMWVWVGAFIFVFCPTLLAIGWVVLKWRDAQFAKVIDTFDKEDTSSTKTK